MVVDQVGRYHCQDQQNKHRRKAHILPLAPDLGDDDLRLILADVLEERSVAHPKLPQLSPLPGLDTALTREPIRHAHAAAETISEHGQDDVRQQRRKQDRNKKEKQGGASATRRGVRDEDGKNEP